MTARSLLSIPEGMDDLMTVLARHPRWTHLRPTRVGLTKLRQRPVGAAALHTQVGFTHGAGPPRSSLGAGAVFGGGAATPFLTGLTLAPSISTLISSSEVSPDFPT